ncbi:MAG: hypothetical protein UW63_C0065G0004 [Candidatus Uhrbacteria bacterium GW2011_GWF2_44_350]|uniref:Transcription regulator TrmB N-terminal domain-containing protein n=1 Tax=Candidatus Uhrbacteria bacterium GW2011_GWF2_44_350 TaxID=1619000 RepID=A0A0G1JC47_9BACT|nr:MAG: hypothetical protein UW63_C0065G0004 [Candidatus Uhrbacteria bacterium GW2011_GWF2_44_350]
MLVYELLLETGRQKARDLVSPSGLGRGNVYNILLQLEAKGLIFSIKGKQTVYEAAPPAKLQDLVEAKIRSAKQLETDYSTALSSLSSIYNLSTGRPAVQVYEGLEGWEKVLEDTLESKTEICAYLDTTIITDDLAKINARYLKKRVRSEVQKNILIIDTPETRKFFSEQNTPFTKVGFIKNFPAVFSSSMQLYDNTVIYFSQTENKKISLVIKDPLIYKTHRDQFNWIWSQAEVVDYAAFRES